jgi:hypothetical protein
MPTGSQGSGAARRARIAGRGGRVAKIGPARGSSRRAGAARSPRLDALVEELRGIAERLGIRVREEKLLREVGYHTQSGRCRVGEEEILLLDHELSGDLKVDLLTSVLAGRDLAGFELSEEARRALAIAASDAPHGARATAAAPAGERGASRAKSS